MDKNAFGGGNPNSVYVPMSELEQEVVSRLVESGDLRVHIVGWGVVNRPRATFGDARLSLRFDLHFDRPEAPMAVPYLDLELRTGAGLLLVRERQPTMYGGQPMMAAAGVTIGMIWDIAIQRIDPNLVKAIVPNAHGLTSRLTDKDTGDATLMGNMRLNENQKLLLRYLRRGEAKARASTAERLAKEALKSGK